jgi:LEA14-like dessication related protein
MRTWQVVALTLVLGMVSSGCAGFHLERPRVTISDLSVREATFFEQVFDVQLRVQNPNDAELAINGLAFDIELNDVTFASGLSNERMTVPRFGSAVIKAEAVSGITGILKQIMEMQKSSFPGIRYRITGKVYLGTLPYRISFEEKGELKLPIGTETGTGKETGGGKGQP